MKEKPERSLKKYRAPIEYLRAIGRARLLMELFVFIRAEPRPVRHFPCDSYGGEKSGRCASHSWAKAIFCI